MTSLIYLIFTFAIAQEPATQEEMPIIETPVIIDIPIAPNVPVLQEIPVIQEKPNAPNVPILVPALQEIPVAPNVPIVTPVRPEVSDVSEIPIAPDGTDTLITPEVPIAPNVPIAPKPEMPIAPNVQIISEIPAESNLDIAQDVAIAPNLLSTSELVQQFEICTEAEKAGFQTYGKYLLNPKDFQSLELQSIVHPYLQRLNLALQSQDINLVSLVLPPRGVLFPELDPTSQYSYYQLLTDLESTGLRVISVSTILENFGADFFFEYDHHWTPFAAREVAKEIAKNVAIDPEIQQDFISEQIRYSWSPYNSRLKTLTKLCGADYAARANPVEQTSDGNDEATFLTSWTTTMSASEGLFDTRDSENTQPSILVGTSNSESSTLNFAGFLSEQTGLSISNYAFSSSGALGSMMHYFLSTEFEQSKPRYIFWEFLANPHTTDYNLNAIKYYRQIIPSISGSCKPNALANATFELKNDSTRQYLNLFLEESVVQTIDNANYYLSFDVSGDYLDRIIIDVEYNSGLIDQSSLQLLAPLASKQQGYLEFLNTPGSQVQGIYLSFPANSDISDISATTNVNIDLCLTP